MKGFRWGWLSLVVFVLCWGCKGRGSDKTVGDGGAAATSSSGAGFSAVGSAPSSQTSPTGAKSVDVLKPPPDMVLVPAGDFTMGDNSGKNESPARKVTISRPFFIDKLEVSVGGYQKCVVAGQCSPSGIHGPDVSIEMVERYRTMCNAQYEDRNDHPINCVDARQAADYCSFVQKRLPTEAEWEYAARGPDGRAYPWGNDEPGCDKAVVSGCGKVPEGKAGTKEIGSFPNAKSPFGAYDMAGNVFEWVADGWNSQAYEQNSSTDPFSEPLGQYGVLRGGGWDFAPDRLKTWYRQRFVKKMGQVSTGFRCARTVGEGSPSDEPMQNRGAVVGQSSICPNLFDWRLDKYLGDTCDEKGTLAEECSSSLANLGPTAVRTHESQRASGKRLAVYRMLAETVADRKVTELEVTLKEIQMRPVSPGQEQIKAGLIEDYQRVIGAYRAWARAMRGYDGTLAPFMPAKEIADRASFEVRRNQQSRSSFCSKQK